MPVVRVAKAETGPHCFVVGGAVQQDLEDLVVIFVPLSAVLVLVKPGMGRVGRLAVNCLESISPTYRLSAVGWDGAGPGLVHDLEDGSCVGWVGRG